ncbi:MAG TPA: TolC family protein [Pirellulales bacterium]|nr:TolC family protein [Pirellulales bacterium]
MVREKRQVHDESARGAGAAAPMGRRRVATAVVLAAAIFSCQRSAPAQLIGLSDEIILLSKGLRQREQNLGRTPLGLAAGAGASPLDNRANARRGGAPPGAPSGTYSPSQRDALSVLSRPMQGTPGPRATLRMVQGSRAAELPAPIYGPLEIPQGEEEGPSDGLTLDQAIEKLVRENYDLRSKAYEIPQARADVLTAGLRANPFVFGTASSYPYQAYSPSRPGQNSYSMTVIQAIDVNRKRLARIEVATRAKQVLEAQYQDAVRIEIDNLYNVFLDVVAARESLRYARAGLAGLDRVLRTARGQFDAGDISEPEYERVAGLRDTAEIQLEQADFAMSQAKLSLAAMINIPPSEADGIELRGTLTDTAPPPPPREELLRIAFLTRPDLKAYSLGIRRAQADVGLSRKERFSDVFLLYSPYEYRNNAPTGGQSVASWSVAAMATVPLYNRNQGIIRRAELNVRQTQMEMQALRRQIASEVERAEREYAASGAVVERMQRDILPRGIRIRDAVRRLFEGKEASALEFLNAQRAFNDDVRAFRDAVIRHRRSMLRLNTAVGQRIMP